MKTKILRNIFISVGELFAPAQLLAAGTSAGVSNLSKTPLTAPQPTFVTFDPPGGPARDMLPSGINPAGAITGTYITGSSNLEFHGFLREPNGTFTTIDPPGSTGAWIGFFFGLVGPPINPAGAITGTYFDASGVQHGFLRAPDGTFTTFDVPGDVNGIDPQGINAAGAITGFYFDASGAVHGFLRAPDGTFTTFDVPGAVGLTAAEGINLGGTIAGFYADASFVFHGFLRAPDGTITTIDPPGSAATFPAVINPAGVITGDYFDASGATHGFLRIP